MRTSHCFSLFLVVLPSLACSASGETDPRGSSSGGANTVAGNASGGAKISGGAPSSSSGGTTGINVPTGGGVAGEENCGFQHFDLKPVPADVLLVLDRSASMKDAPDGASSSMSKWDIVVPAVTEVINQTGSRVSWGMKSFPEGEGSECISGSVTNKVDVTIADNNAAAVVNQVKATQPNGNGTPTGDAIKASVTYLQSVNNGHKKYLLLATDGEPSCAGTTKDSAQARTYAAQAVAAALSAGFPTYVVGVATTKDSATQALNAMATAGGVPTGGTNPLATKYYLASTQAALVSALQAITGDVAKTCVFNLDPPPPAPDFIAVKVSGAIVARDPESKNGWEYTNAQRTALQVYGSACETIQQSADSVEIIYGCQGVVPK
ncbi:MAG: vWA domain-containing protein [Myxococcota bacterium]